MYDERHLFLDANKGNEYVPQSFVSFLRKGTTRLTNRLSMFSVVQMPYSPCSFADSSAIGMRPSFIELAWDIAVQFCKRYCIVGVRTGCSLYVWQIIFNNLYICTWSRQLLPRCCRSSETLDQYICLHTLRKTTQSKMLINVCSIGDPEIIALKIYF